MCRQREGASSDRKLRMWGTLMLTTTWRDKRAGRRKTGRTIRVIMRIRSSRWLGERIMTAMLRGMRAKRVMIWA